MELLADRPLHSPTQKMNSKPAISQIIAYFGQSNSREKLADAILGEVFGVAGNPCVFGGRRDCPFHLRQLCRLECFGSVSFADRQVLPVRG
jgi:hypothetical protein